MKKAMHGTKTKQAAIATGQSQIIGKSFSAKQISETIKTGKNSLVGFLFSVNNLGSEAKPDHDIIMKNVYFDGNQRTFSTTDSVVSGTIELIPSGQSPDANIPKEVQFYHKAMKKQKNFGWAFISRDDMFLFSEYSEKILVSGAKVTPGQTGQFIDSTVKPSKSYLTLKFEADLVREESREAEAKRKESDDGTETQILPRLIPHTALSIDQYPQILFGSPCPPYWAPLIIPPPFSEGQSAINDGTTGDYQGNQN